MLTHDLDISVLGSIETLRKLALAGFLLILVYLFVNELVCYNQQIPGLAIPQVLPLVGNLPQLRTNATQEYREWAKARPSLSSLPWKYSGHGN